MAKLSTSELKVIISGEKADSLSADDAAKLSEERRRNMNYYQGDVSEDMPTIKGRSQVVSTDVADTIDGMMPDLMQTFCGTDSPVKFSPRGPEDVEAAEQETEAVNHEFMQRNAGFLVLYQFIKDALLSKLSIVKVFPHKTEKAERETYVDQSAEAFAMLVANQPDRKVVEHSERVDEETGETLHDVTLEVKTKRQYARVECVPPEEFGVSRKARIDCFHETSYCFHEVETTEGKLIEEGYDEAQVKKLPSYPTQGRNSEQQARDTVDESTKNEGDTGIKGSARPLMKTEHYIVIDYAGDGYPCLYRVTTGGDDSEILMRDGQPDVVRQDMLPFAVMTPIIMPHRLIGRSVADIVIEIMKIKTALQRGALDNIYLSLNPRMEVSEQHAGDKTLEDLLVSRPGGVVRTKMPGGLQPILHPDVGQHVYPMLEYQDQRREMMTGVTRQGQGMDAEALVNESATKAKQMFSMAKARIRLIARVFAETGIKDMFGLVHATMRKLGGEAETRLLRNKWVPVNPREWKQRTDFTIDVGLGDGDKAEQLAGLQVLGQMQEKMALAGFNNIVTPDNIYNTGAEACRILEKKDPSRFFTDPQGQPPAPVPDPKMQIEQMKVEADKEKTAIDAQARQQELQSKAEIERIQAEADVATQRMKVESEIMLAREKFQLDAELKREEHQMKMREMGATLQMKEREAQIRDSEAQRNDEFSRAEHGRKLEQMKAKPKAEASA